MWRAARRPKASSRLRLTGCRQWLCNDDDERTLQAGLDQAKLRTDMINSARYLKGQAISTGKLGVTGFCWGGGTTNFLAMTLGPDMHAGVPYYGAAAEDDGVSKIKAPLPDPVRRER